jgi:hypothetical protein
MKYLISSLSLLLLSLSSLAQVNYLDYKARYNLSCGTPDSIEITRNQVLIDSLEGSTFSEGEKEYRYDLGWVYYMRYVKWKEKVDLTKSMVAFEKGWEDFSDLTALWNLGTIYEQFGDCKKALDATELYLKEIPEEKKPDYQQIYYRYKSCRGKE